MAASVYRLAVLSNKRHYVSYAESYRSALVAGSGTVSIDSGGWLQPVVNPRSFGVSGSNSPEAESFVLLMESAHRDWVNDGRKGENSAAPRVHIYKFASTSVSVVVGIIMGAMLL